MLDSLEKLVHAAVLAELALPQVLEASGYASAGFLVSKHLHGLLELFKASLDRDYLVLKSGQHLL